MDYTATPRARSSRQSIDRLSAVAGALLCLVIAGATVSGAHETGTHEQPDVPSEPGRLAIPAPGSYSLPALGPAADGRVLTADAEPTRLHTLFGDRVVLLAFIYTRCSDGAGCPLATAVLHRVGQRIASEPDVLDRLRLLSLSFDPENDTPEVMRRYGGAFAREGLDWQFITTPSEEALAPLLDAYRQTRVSEVNERGEETGQYAHLLRVFLIDPARRVRQVYSTSLLDPDALVVDVRSLLLEQDRARIAAPDSPIEPRDEPKLAGVERGSGDDRGGYERADYTTRTLSLRARRGLAADLLSHAATAPLGLPPIPVPDDNPLTPAKVALGRQLFFDRRLSRNDTISCAMCHVPEQGFANNEMATAVGIEGRTVRRNAPTIYNTAYLSRLFHDGRSNSLEEQAWGPMLAPNEMGNPSRTSLVEKLRRLDDYPKRFSEAFPERGLDADTIAMALASYERTLVSGGSDFDRYFYGNDRSALSDAAGRGLELFTGNAGCAACHALSSGSSLFSDGGFHNTGVGVRAADHSDSGTLRVQAAPGVYLDVPRSIIADVSEPPHEDLGRYEVTADPADLHRYRTPTLRNVALTAPYMHDGSIATLRGVVEFYRAGGVSNPGLDPRVRPLALTDADVSNLVAFLESLTGPDVDTLVADAFAAPVGER